MRQGPAPAFHLRAIAASLGAALATYGGTATAQRYEFNSGISSSVTYSSNPDLAPSGQEEAGGWLDISPYFTLSGTGGRLRVYGGGALGATVDLRGSSGDGLTFRPSGNLNASLEAVDNFFFVDARALVQSTLDNPFLATSSPTSPVNTSTYYQLGIAPYLRGRLAGALDYEVRSDNSWTNDFGSRQLLYSGQHSARIERAPQPFGGMLSYERASLQSDVEGQGRLISDVARASLRYAPMPDLAVGVRIGWEQYNYTLVANDPQTFYGFELRWQPTERTLLEGYWEDRVFGNSWRMEFTHRRPLVAFSIYSTRDLSSTPQQFLAIQQQGNLASLVDAAFTTRFPDPAERQRAVSEFLAQNQLPSQLLSPTLIYNEQITIQANTTASVVFYGRRNSLSLSIFRTATEGVAGFSSVLPVLSNTVENGVGLAFNHRMTPVTSLNATATWRYTKSLLDEEDTTTQAQFYAGLSRQFAPRTFGTLGARYQRINSTVTNDATEAALYFTLTHRF